MFRDNFRVVSSSYYRTSVIGGLPPELKANEVNDIPKQNNRNNNNNNKNNNVNTDTEFDSVESVIKEEQDGGSTGAAATAA